MTSEPYRNAMRFNVGRPTRAVAMVAVDGRVRCAGDLDTARRLAGPDSTVFDPDGALVPPGFVAGHAYILSTGEVRDDVDLWGGADLSEIQHRVTGRTVWQA